MSRLLQRESKLQPDSPLRNSRVVAVAIGLYVALVLFASFHYNISLTPDRVILLLAIIGLGTGRVRLFLKDWSIFLIILLAWQVLSGYTRTFSHLKPHVTEMINFDRLIFFGHLPTVWLQSHLYHPGTLHWYDIGAGVLYMLHFLYPMGIALLIWAVRRPVFIEFMISFLILALAGFATFALFPAAPPWLAGNWHYIPHVYRIFDRDVHFFGGHQSFSALYQWLWNHNAWDRVAAVPSEHAGFPFLCFLYARQLWPRLGWLLLLYCAVVWGAVIYLGEHYAFDVVAGVLYASLAYVAVQLLVRQYRARARRQAQNSPTTVVEQLPA